MPKIELTYGPDGLTYDDFRIPEIVRFIASTYEAGIPQRYTISSGAIIDALIVPIVEGRIDPTDITVAAGAEIAHMNRYGVLIVDCEVTPDTPWGWKHLDGQDWPATCENAELRLKHATNLRKAEKAAKENNHV
jgi:hypothetical protein